MDESKTYYLYWLHRPCHKSFKTEDYVGITYDVGRRMSAHRREMKKGTKTHLYNAMRKYDDISVKVLCIGSRDYIKDLEKKLRPDYNIGWNTAIGGSCSAKKLTKQECVYLAERLVKYSKLTALNVLVDYFENGMTHPEIVDKHDITVSTSEKIVKGSGTAYPDLEDVRSVLRENMIHVSHKWNSLTENVYEEIATKRENGANINDLSSDYNIPVATLEGYFSGKSKYIRKFSNFRIVSHPGPERFEFDGLNLTMREWSEKLGICKKTLKSRIRKGWSLEKAFTTPLIKNKSAAGKLGQIALHKKRENRCQ